MGEYMKKLLLFPVLLLAIANLSMAKMMVSEAEITKCKPIEIIDGNNIICLTDKKEQVKVRLYQIDAPELDQPFGEKAKQVLSKMIYDRVVKIDSIGDRYKLTLSTISYFSPVPCPLSNPKLGNQHRECVKIVNVNLEMIKQGYAWYNRFDGENPAYKQEEQEARAAKRGLWTDDNPISPWGWRAKNKK